MFKKILRYFTKFEWALWLTALTVITVGFAVSDERSVLSYLSSLLGVTCIIFSAKGNVISQGFGIGFSVLYSTYSYIQHYYGEMLIYIFVMIPIHITTIITWLRNKFDKRVNEVKINVLRPREYILTGLGAAAATVGFYFLLSALNTDNVIVSTISLTTSITAAYLMLRRCQFFSICFIANDVVLVVLWSLKLASEGLQVLPSVLAFIIFLVTDSYCFISWQRMKRRQSATGVKVSAAESVNEIVIKDVNDSAEN